MNDETVMAPQESTTTEAPQGSEYVTIPLENIHEELHAPIQVNKKKFFAGNTYLVDKDVAADVKDRLAAYAKAQIRLLQRNPDKKALRDAPQASDGANYVQG